MDKKKRNQSEVQVDVWLGFLVEGRKWRIENAIKCLLDSMNRWKGKFMAVSEFVFHQLYFSLHISCWCRSFFMDEVEGRTITWMVSINCSQDERNSAHFIRLQLPLTTLICSIYLISPLLIHPSAWAMVLLERNREDKLKGHLIIDDD